MNKLTHNEAKETFTSLELVELINQFRTQEGNRKDLKHNDFLKVIRDEFEDELREGNISLMFQTIEIANGAKRESPYYILDLQQSRQVLVRESKFVRKAVIKYIDELENKLKHSSYNLPQTYIEALERLLQSEKDKLIMLPKVEYYDELVDKNLLTSLRTTAKELQIKERIFVNTLLEKGYLYRDKKNKLQPYAEYIGKMFEIKEFKNTQGFVGNQVLITTNGRNILRKLFKQ